MRVEIKTGELFMCEKYENFASNENLYLRIRPTVCHVDAVLNLSVEFNQNVESSLENV